MAAAILGLGAVGCSGTSDDPTVKHTALGKVSGKELNGVYAWLGMPYGKAARWQAPTAPDAWTGTRKLDTPAPPCAQVGSIYGPPPAGQDVSHLADAFWKPQGQEDCLYLNVWRPATSESNLPVIVFIHGGSNRVGYASDPGYDGSGLARGARAVVIGTNYRLGWFGWMNHPALQATPTDPASSGNFAILDLIQALRFVKENVASFGGDPANVTISGQSAGAIDVHGLVLSPLAAGLFTKAISMSGFAAFATVAAAQAAADNLVDQLLARDGRAGERAGMTPDQVKAYLLSKATEDLLDVQIDPSAWGGTGNYAVAGPPAVAGTLALPPAPIGDGVVEPLPLAPGAPLPSTYNRVPIVIGTTAEEGKLFLSSAGASAYRLTDAQRFDLMYRSNRDAPAEKLADILNTEGSSGPFCSTAGGLPACAVFTGTDDATLAPQYDLYALGGGGTLPGGAPQPRPRFWTELFHSLVDGTTQLYVAQQPQQTWAYSFDWAGEAEPWRTIYGAVHLIDLPFYFGNFSHEQLLGAFFPGRSQAGRAALSNAFQKSVAAFARTGDPNDPALGTTWSPATVSGSPAAVRGKLHFNATDAALLITSGP